MTTPFDLAQSQVGKTDAMISDFLRTGGQNLDPQQLAWCAAFVNSSLKQAGLPDSGSNMARSLLNVGAPTSAPQKGDLAVFWRGSPNGTLGHVGFFDSQLPNGRIRILGGNQDDAVGYTTMNPKTLLGYRSLSSMYGGAGGNAVTPSKTLPMMAQAGAAQPVTPGIQMTPDAPQAKGLAAMYAAAMPQMQQADEPTVNYQQEAAARDAERKRRLAALFSP